MPDQNDEIHSVALGIDAFAFKIFQTRELTSFINFGQNNELKIFNHGFLFLMIPTDSSFPSLNLHIKKELDGNYNKTIENIANFIIIALITKGFNVWFKATDGDGYPSLGHITFYNNYISW